MSDAWVNRVTSLKSSEGVTEEGKENNKNLKELTSTGSKETPCKSSCPFRPRSLSADGIFESIRNNPAKVGGGSNRMITEDSTSVQADLWRSAKKPPDVGYLLVIREEVIYRIPIILDISRVDESRRDKNDPNEKKLAVPETNENKICVMMKTRVAQNLETALKELFQYCDWIQILAASSLPDKVRRDLEKSYTVEGKFQSEKRPHSANVWEVPSKKSFRPQESSATLNKRCSGEGYCNSQHSKAPLNPDLFNGDYLPFTSTTSCQSASRTDSFVRKASLSAINASTEKSEVGRNTSSLAFVKASTQKANTAQVQPLPQSQGAHPLILSNTATDQTAQNDHRLVKSSESESRNTQNNSMPAFMHTLNHPAINMTTVTESSGEVHSRSQRPLFLSGGVFVPQIAPLFSISNGNAQQHQRLSPTQNSKITIHPTTVCSKCQVISHHAAMSSNEESPMDLSNKLPTDVGNLSNSRRTGPNNYEEGVAINLAKPKQSKPCNTQVGSPKLEGNRGIEPVHKTESTWKCHLCNLEFDKEWWLHKHYRGQRHVCKLLDSFDGSQILQKRIKCREINSETLVNEMTGQLRLNVVNRLISSSDCSANSRFCIF